MSAYRSRLTGFTPAVLLPASSRIPAAARRREDRIFRVILPGSWQHDEFVVESPQDWGSRILTEGDVESPLSL